MNAIWTIGVVASLLFAWVCLFHVVPSNLTSMFRFRIWCQRDELSAAIRAGEFSDVDQAERLLALMESFVRLAPQFSAFRITLARFSALSIRAEQPKMFDISELPPEEQQRFRKRLEKFNDTVANHVLFETPSGWLVLAISLLLAPILIPRSRRRNRIRGTRHEAPSPVVAGRPPKKDSADGRLSTRHRRKSGALDDVRKRASDEANKLAQDGLLVPDSSGTLLGLAQPV